MPCNGCQKPHTLNFCSTNTKILFSCLDIHRSQKLYFLLQINWRDIFLAYLANFRPSSEISIIYITWPSCIRAIWSSHTKSASFYANLPSISQKISFSFYCKTGEHLPGMHTQKMKILPWKSQAQTILHSDYSSVLFIYSRLLILSVSFATSIK